MLEQNSYIQKVTWLAIVMISLAAIVLINQFSPYVPDYDGLKYFDVAKIMNSWLYEPSDHQIWNEGANASVAFWPISNAISVIIAAVFYKTISLNILPSLINTIYLLVFTSYLRKIRPALYVLIATLLLCSTTLFFRLFTTFTTEFSVGLWIFSFLLTLISNHERRGMYLAVLIVIGLMLRTIDIVFILMAVSAYAAISYFLWNDRQHIFTTLRSVGLSLVITAPFMFQHYIVAFQYIYNASFGPAAASWKSLGGVNSRYDVLHQYITYLSLYNPITIPVTFFIISFGFYCKAVDNRFIFLILGLAVAVCFPLLMASSLNIQVVFWIYASIIFIVCEVGFLIFNNYFVYQKKSLFRIFEFKNVFVGFIFLSCILFLVRSWNYEVPYIKQQGEVSRISFEIAKILGDKINGQSIAFNYHGVGALDGLGLAWLKDGRYAYGGIEDIYSKNKKPLEYLELKENTNFYIAAHENYFFAPHFGINDHVKEIYHLFLDKASSLGFIKVQEVSVEGKSFDIWYRPGVLAHPQYASYGDNWISSKLPLDLGNQELCSGRNVSGVLSVSLLFPDPKVSNYSPPFLISIRAKNTNQVISSSIVNDFGYSDIAFNLKNITCDKYELYIDKAFSTSSDPRKLSAQFVKLDSALKFNLSEKGSE